MSIVASIASHAVGAGRMNMAGTARIKPSVSASIKRGLAVIHIASGKTLPQNCGS